ELFKEIGKVARREGFRHIADASNYDDRKDFRPGSRAAKESGVASPLKEARLTKDDIRRLSKKLGLPTWDKPSYACLASRIPYHDTITRRKLEMIEKAEDILRNNYSFSQVRVRCHGDIARIEVAPREIRKFFKGEAASGVGKNLQKLGFKYVTVDILGYRTGSMNETLWRR
ncbi:MAG: TIGR00268 family protein, partial [Candidatus Omnitrophica bacterium]|nr:TIGR00268 family protein [Candidatus Omnitrophota bacterium]